MTQLLENGPTGALTPRLWAEDRLRLKRNALRLVR
jgi:hypothetical protein